MNIFEYYLTEINNLVLIHKDDLKLKDLEEIDNVNLAVPPEQFDFDLSCNIALVLAKSNNINPRELATNLKKLFTNRIINFDNIEIAGPGFLNIKLSKIAIIDNINLILKNNQTYGSKKTNESYNIEFVLSLIPISEPTRRTPISYAVFCLKKKKCLRHG